MKKSAFTYGSMLMRPEYKSQLSEKFKPKIIKLVRRPVDTEPDDNVSPCPYCRLSLPNYRLDCPQCHNHLPYCIASGRHMTLTDWTSCPDCKFPALHSVLTSQIAKGQSACPMCTAELTEGSLLKLTEFDAKVALTAKAQKDAEDKENNSEADEASTDRGSSAGSGKRRGSLGAAVSSSGTSAGLSRAGQNWGNQPPPAL